MEENTYTPNPWELPKDKEVVGAAATFISRYELQKVNADIRMSGLKWLEEGFKAGADWARHVNNIGD